MLLRPGCRAVTSSYRLAVVPSSNSTSATNPDKPYPKFPLLPQDTKRWAKKTKGRAHCFAQWSDRKAAIERYQYAIHDSQQGKIPSMRNVDALDSRSGENEIAETVCRALAPVPSIRSQTHVSGNRRHEKDTAQMLFHAKKTAVGYVSPVIRTVNSTKKTTKK